MYMAARCDLNCEADMDLRRQWSQNKEGVKLNKNVINYERNEQNERKGKI